MTKAEDLLVRRERDIAAVQRELAAQQRMALFSVWISLWGFKPEDFDAGAARRLWREGGGVMAKVEDLLVKVECNDVVGTIERAIEDMVKRVIEAGVSPDVRAWVCRDVQAAIAMGHDNMLRCEFVRSPDPSVCLVNVSVDDAFKARTVAAVTRIYRKPAAV